MDARTRARAAPVNDLMFIIYSFARRVVIVGWLDDSVRGSNNSIIYEEQ